MEDVEGVLAVTIAQQVERAARDTDHLLTITK
jgi:hypothetical protein